MSSKSVPKPRVLVVDDDKAVRESLRRSLEFNGYDVSVASDGAEALAGLSAAGIYTKCIAGVTALGKGCRAFFIGRLRHQPLTDTVPEETHHGSRIPSEPTRTTWPSK